jgi:hypothetical protein
MDQVGLDPRSSALRGWPGFKVVQPETWLPHVYTRRRSPSQWRKSVEAASLGRPATWLGRPGTKPTSPGEWRFYSPL